jgi:hypothetical protein
LFALSLNEPIRKIEESIPKRIVIQFGKKSGGMALEIEIFGLGTSRGMIKTYRATLKQRRMIAEQVS